jgi:NADPH:quinone reductase-like Zn-dependent oxidoreductase
MKAVRIHEFGDANVLTMEETPKPVLHDGEILIKVRAASVNRSTPRSAPEPSRRPT